MAFGSCTTNDWAACPARLRAGKAREVMVVTETATAPMQLLQQRDRAQLAVRPGGRRLVEPQSNATARSQRQHF